ncbi:MAG: hypothetical protein WAU65_03290 [Candidatus Nanoarchaeia archaeon]
MKKGKKNSKRVYNNRLLYTLIVIGILAIAGVAVYADAPSATIPNPGHPISQIQTCNTAGDILEMVSGSWTCVQAPTPGVSSPQDCSGNNYLQYTSASGWVCSALPAYPSVSGAIYGQCTMEYSWKTNSYDTIAGSALNWASCYSATAPALCSPSTGTSGFCSCPSGYSRIDMYGGVGILQSVASGDTRVWYEWGCIAN